jgi:hypothetical protein
MMEGTMRRTIQCLSIVLAAATAAGLGFSVKAIHAQPQTTETSETLLEAPEMKTTTDDLE